jgi:serine O-acetyltransferase
MATGMLQSELSKRSWIIQTLDKCRIKMAKDLPTNLVYGRKRPILGVLAYYALKILGVEIPRGVPIGPGFELAHGGVGVVIHSKAVIGARVKIYPGVTIGRADIYRPASESKFEGIIIEDDVILAPGAKILCKAGVLRVGRGSVIGANAVLLESTGEAEVWAGAPARCVGRREGWPDG